jgi:NAD(P)-dependent dehydrogenase (short-subunit alcohol dehydrogenase family)
VPPADPVALITGAAGQLGRVAARRLADSGARLVLVGSTQESLAEVADEAGAGEESTMTLAADLRDPAAAERVVAEARERFGRIDILLQLVGGWTGGKEVSEAPREEFAGMLDQHLWTTLNVLRPALPGMVEAGWGRVVAVSSPYAANPQGKSGPYSVGKAAQEALMATVAREVAGSGVTANVLLVRSIRPAKEGEDPQVPHKEGTSPELIAAAIAWLCSDQAAAVNGARLPLHTAV